MTKKIPEKMRHWHFATCALILVPDKKNAGAIFFGNWSPEAIGDYLGGPNHTLPTSGTARFAGALGVETFMKNTSYAFIFVL